LWRQRIADHSPNIPSPNVPSPNIRTPNIHSPNIRSPNIPTPNIPTHATQDTLTEVTEHTTRYAHITYTLQEHLCEDNKP
jgi:hypothetical protein